MQVQKYIILILTLTTTLLFPTTKTFVACEGHFYGGSGSVNVFNGEEVYSIDDLGNTVQSLKVYNDKLFVIVNGTSQIHVYSINETDETLITTIETGYSGPREMEIHNGYLYFTNWYSYSIMYMDPNTYEIIGTIPVDGLPEDIVSDGTSLWVTINMNIDWSDGNKVLKINTDNNTIEEYIVGLGPKNLVLHNEGIYISRIFYDENWNTFHGTSRINSDGSVEQVNYGAGLACGGSIVKYNNQVYRSYNGGIAPLDNNLNIEESLRVGDYGYWNVYDVKTIDNNIYFAITDWNSIHQVAIVDSNGDEIALFDTGIIPTDFEKWTDCIATGDYNQDNQVNVTDAVSLVDIIINNQEVDLCAIDMNGDNELNISDIIIIIDIILSD